MSEMPLYVFFYLEKLVCESFTDVLCLQGQSLFELRFLLFERLDLIFVVIKLLLDLLDHFL